MNKRSDWEILNWKLQLFGLDEAGETLVRRAAAFLIALSVLATSCTIGCAQSKSPVPTPNSAKYTVEPSRAARGQTRETLLKTDPPTDLSKVTVEAFEGSGITIEGQYLIDGNLAIAVKLRVRGDANLGTAKLKVVDAGDPNKKNISSVSLSITDIEPLAKQPTPGGISEVDATWIIQPGRIVEGNFGHYVAANFYCIEVTIGNNTGYDLEIARVLFEGILDCTKDMPAAKDSQCLCDPESPKTKFPASNYRLVRGMLERGQQVGRRNTTINILVSLGMILTGFIPFYENIRPKAHFTAFSNIVNGPFKEGLALSFPDRTIRQLSRLSDQALQNSIIIENNSEVAFTVFVPKDIFHFASKEEREQPWKVMPRLGQLILIGNIIKALNRTIVLARPNPENPGPEPKEKEPVTAKPQGDKKSDKDKDDKKPPSEGETDGNKGAGKPIRQSPEVKPNGQVK